jgi:hypothetical protein
MRTAQPGLAVRFGLGCSGATSRGGNPRATECSLILAGRLGLSNPNAPQERDRRSQIGSQETGRELFHVSEGLHGFPTAPMDCQVLGDNAHALQWATPRSRKAAAQRQGSGEGHSDIKAVCALKLVMIGPERATLIFHPRAGGRVSGKRLWRINAMTNDQPERIAA